MLPAGVTRHICDGNGTTRNWNFTFPIFTTDGSDIKVYKTAADGTITEITSNYNVSVAGGYVTYPTIVSGLPLLVAGEKITLLRVEALSQLVDWKNKGPFNAEIVEAVADRIVAILQQHEEELGRVVKYSVDQTPVADEISAFITNIENLEDIEDAILSVLAAQVAAEAAQAAAEVAKSGAEAAQVAAEAAQAAAEAAVASIPALDTDGALTANSDTRIPSQQAVKEYADTKVIAPASNTADKVPQWNGANSKTLKDGLAVGMSANCLLQLDSNAKIPAVDGSQLTNLPVDLNTSNVVFSFALGGGSHVADTNGVLTADTIIGAEQTIACQYWAVIGTTARTVLTTKFKKIAGISTVTVWCRIWQQSNGTPRYGVCTVSIGAASGSVNGTDTQQTPEWKSFTIDVSGLSNGTTYDVTIQLNHSSVSTLVYMDSVIGIAS